MLPHVYKYNDQRTWGVLLYLLMPYSCKPEPEDQLARLTTQQVLRICLYSMLQAHQAMLSFFLRY